MLPDAYTQLDRPDLIGGDLIYKQPDGVTYRGPVKSIFLTHILGGGQHRIRFEWWAKATGAGWEHVLDDTDQPVSFYFDIRSERCRLQPTTNGSVHLIHDTGFEFVFLTTGGEHLDRNTIRMPVKEA